MCLYESIEEKRRGKLYQQKTHCSGGRSGCEFFLKHEISREKRNEKLNVYKCVCPFAVDLEFGGGTSTIKNGAMGKYINWRLPKT